MVPAQSWSLGKQKMILTREGGQNQAESEPGTWPMEVPLGWGKGALLPNLETSAPQVTRNGENMSLEILRQRILLGWSEEERAPSRTEALLAKSSLACSCAEEDSALRTE